MKCFIKYLKKIMIEGKIINIVALSDEHLDFMLNMLNNQEIAYLEGRTEALISKSKQKNWFDNNLASENHYLIINSKDGKDMYGYMSFKITNKVSRDGHIAIKLVSNARGKGIAIDALKTAMRFYFFNFNIHRLHSHIIAYNIPSQKLFIEKCGWRKEGNAVKSIYINGKYHDNYLVAILKEEFIKNEIDSFYNPILE
jgi:RimJ/RimL family protein N-acetyltransferase